LEDCLHYHSTQTSGRLLLPLADQLHYQADVIHDASGLGHVVRLDGVRYMVSPSVFAKIKVLNDFGKVLLVAKLLRRSFVFLKIRNGVIDRIDYLIPLQTLYRLDVFDLQKLCQRSHSVGITRIK
jgi:hypothetical protein